MFEFSKHKGRTIMKIKYSSLVLGLLLPITYATAEISLTPPGNVMLKLLSQQNIKQ